MLIEASLLDNGNNPWIKNSNAKLDLVLSQEFLLDPLYRIISYK